MAKTLEFRLAPNNPLIGVMTRMVWGTAVLGLAVIWSLYAAGRFDGETTLIVSLFLIVVSPLMIRRFRQMGKGTVKLASEGLLVHMGGGFADQAYRWEHVAAVRLSNAAEQGTLDRFWARMGGLDQNAPFVVIKLNRPARLNFLTERIGTSVWGIPSLISTVKLYLVEADELVRVAQAFLKPPLDGGRV